VPWNEPGVAKPESLRGVSSPLSHFGRRFEPRGGRFDIATGGLWCFDGDFTDRRKTAKGIGSIGVELPQRGKPLSEAPWDDSKSLSGGRFPRSLNCACSSFFPSPGLRSSGVFPPFWSLSSAMRKTSTLGASELFPVTYPGLSGILARPPTLVKKIPLPYSHIYYKT
jgi:hypothetical protein